VANLLLLAALLLPLHACTPTGPEGRGTDGAHAGGATPAPLTEAGPAQSGAAKAPDRGDFRVARREAAGGRSAEELRELAEEERSLGEMADELNRAFSLPHDILIGFDECGEPNAFYDPERKQITVCDELVSDLYEAFRARHTGQKELDAAVANATTFVFYHELGHALIDAYDLPVTGREEDAVDQLSVLVLADGSEEGEKTVLDAALSFAREGDAELDEMAFADEHSLDRQRFYNIVCLLYGQNEEKFATLVRDGLLPEERAAGCGEEFGRVERAWGALLAPYVK